MPSTTAFFGELITNLGPLTTTYTAPSSCYTGTDHVYYGDKTEWAVIFGAPTCGPKSYGDCLPSGKDFDSLIESQNTSPTQIFINYYSPGLVCPSGWTTAGTLAQTGESGSFKSSGVFTQDPYPENMNPNQALILPRGKAWTEILTESETLAYCCPKGYYAQINGGCWSSLGPLEDFSYSSNCILVYPEDALVTVESFDGSTWTPPLLSVVPVTEHYETIKDKVNPSTDTVVYKDWDIVTMVPAVPLVWQPKDTASASKNDGDNHKDDDNAALALNRPGLAQLMMIMVSVLVGAGLLVIW